MRGATWREQRPEGRRGRANVIRGSRRGTKGQNLPTDRRNRRQCGDIIGLLISPLFDRAVRLFFTLRSSSSSFCAPSYLCGVFRRYGNFFFVYALGSEDVDPNRWPMNRWKHFAWIFMEGRIVTRRFDAIYLYRLYWGVVARARPNDWAHIVVLVFVRNVGGVRMIKYYV